MAGANATLEGLDALLAKALREDGVLLYFLSCPKDDRSSGQALLALAKNIFCFTFCLDTKSNKKVKASSKRLKINFFGENEIVPAYNKAWLW